MYNNANKYGAKSRIQGQETTEQYICRKIRKHNLSLNSKVASLQELGGKSMGWKMGRQIRNWKAFFPSAGGNQLESAGEPSLKEWSRNFPQGKEIQRRVSSCLRTRQLTRETERKARLGILQRKEPWETTTNPDYHHRRGNNSAWAGL